MATRESFAEAQELETQAERTEMWVDYLVRYLPQVPREVITAARFGTGVRKARRDDAWAREMTDMIRELA